MAVIQGILYWDLFNPSSRPSSQKLRDVLKKMGFSERDMPGDLHSLIEWTQTKVHLFMGRYLACPPEDFFQTTIVLPTGIRVIA
jgi:hypothetical protein